MDMYLTSLSSQKHREFREASYHSLFDVIVTRGRQPEYIDRKKRYLFYTVYLFHIYKGWNITSSWRKVVLDFRTSHELVCIDPNRRPNKGIEGGPRRLYSIDEKCPRDIRHQCHYFKSRHPSHNPHLAMPRHDSSQHLQSLNTWRVITRSLVILNLSFRTMVE